MGMNTGLAIFSSKGLFYTSEYDLETIKVWDRIMYNEKYFEEKYGSKGQKYMGIDLPKEDEYPIYLGCIMYKIPPLNSIV